MRAVLDPNVIISALLSERGAPARILRAWRAGAFEVVMSEALLTELRRALAYPKLRRLIREDEADAYVDLLEASATLESDPTTYPLSIRSRDPGDDYLLALAAASGSLLVTGDADLLELSAELPIHSPASFEALLIE